MNTFNRPSPTRRRATIGSAIILALTLTAGSALAQNARPRGENRDNQSTEQRRERPALRGPAVNDDRAPGARRSFGDDNQPTAPNAQRLAPGALRIILQDLANPDVAERLQLTTTQRETIQAHIADFQHKTREHAEQNREEMTRIRQHMRDRAQAGDMNEMDDMSPADERIRSRMAELRESGPSPDQLFTRVWNELNQDQRAIVQERMDTLRERTDAEREERYVRSRTGRNDNNAAPTPRTPPQRPLPPNAGERRRPGPDARPPTDRQPDGMRDRPQQRPEQQQAQRIDPERRERLIRAFAQLSPEQQDQILQRLENLAQQDEQPPSTEAAPNRRQPRSPEQPPQRRGQPQPQRGQN